MSLHFCLEGLGAEVLSLSVKSGQLKKPHPVRRGRSPKLYQESRPVVPHLPLSCSYFYLLLPTRVIMPPSPKRLRLTFEPDFQTQSEIQGLEVADVLITEDKDETSSVSSCSFNFSYPSTSASPPSSPVIPVSPEEEEEREPAATLSPPQSPQSSHSFSASWSTSEGVSNSQEEEDTSSLQTSIDTESLPRDPLHEMVADLVHFMVLKYRLKEPITEAEMLKVVTKRYKKQFPVIFKKASKCLEVICGIDVKEVDPTTHSYVLVNSLDLTHDEVLSDNHSMPKNGLLIIILGVIFIEGNCPRGRHLGFPEYDGSVCWEGAFPFMGSPGSSSPEIGCRRITWSTGRCLTVILHVMNSCGVPGLMLKPVR
uniref:MAGE domain-containing protein n=1 Tax=Ailuropoda melanoleuca TaxID=9646 RepID=A0A7N5KDK0_AILME